MIKLPKTEIKRKSEHGRAGKHGHIMYRRAKIRMTANFSLETTQAKSRVFLSSTERKKKKVNLEFYIQ